MAFRKSTLPLPLIWVYELWSKDDECLYIGETNNWPRRRTNHVCKPESASGRAWKEHAYMVLNMAVDPELERIQKLQPSLNIRQAS